MCVQLTSRSVDKSASQYAAYPSSILTLWTSRLPLRQCTAAFERVYMVVVSLAGPIFCPLSRKITARRSEIDGDQSRSS